MKPIFRKTSRGRRPNRLAGGLLLVGLLLGGFAACPAEAASVEDLTCEIVGGSTITITACDPLASGALVIPDTIDGLPVTVVGANAFYNCRSLTSVVLPSSCREIGARAFYGCGMAGRLELPQGLEHIGHLAFFLSPNLTEVAVPASVAFIGNWAFRRCAQLSAIEVDPLNPAYSSMDGVLFNADQTTLLQYPPAKVAHNYAVPEGVSTLGDFALNECWNLREVALPDSVSVLGRDVFSSCPMLESILVSDEHPFLALQDKVLFNKAMTILFVSLPVNSVGSYAIPDSVETIWDGAFSDCSRLTEITMPEGLASIKVDAFLNCSGLARIDLPDSLLSIGGYAFRYCTFDEVVLPHRLKTIGNHAFGSCHAIEQIRIPASVSHIGGYAFQLCSALDAVVFEGNAPPSIGTEILHRTTSATLYFYEGAEGFSTPTWLAENYPCA